MNKKILIMLSISAMLLTGCGKIYNGNAIIRVNNEAITQSDFNEAYKSITKNNVQDKENPLYMIMKDRIVNELIVKKLLEQEITKRNITISSFEEEQAFRNLVSKYGNKDALQGVLRQKGISNEKFKKDFNNELKMRKLINMLGSSNVTEAEAKKFFKENPNKFKYPEKVRASHILVSANKKEIEKSIRENKLNSALSEEEIARKVQEDLYKQKVKAEKILIQAKVNPNDFERIARENSDDLASGQRGGDLGFFAYEDMVEPFSKAAFSLRPNKISNIVQTDYGYHIIMVKDRAKAGNISYENSKDEIKEYLAMEKQVKLLENLIIQLKNNAKIDFVNEEYKPELIEKTIKDEIKK